MKKINIKARVRRNMLAELSGKHFRHEGSELIQYLNSEKKDALVGIQRDDGIYTIIGNDRVYYSTTHGEESEIMLGDFLNILSREALAKGKAHHFELIPIDSQHSVWVMNAQTMNALWNTMLLLYDNLE